MTRFEDAEDDFVHELHDEVAELTDPRTRRSEAIKHLADGGLPFLVYFAGYQWHGVTAGAIAALATAVLIAAVRLVRGERLIGVGLGALGVAISSGAALLTGTGRDFFAPGMLFNAVALLVTLASLPIRWPVSGEIGRRLGREDPQWRSDPARHGVHVKMTWFWVFLWSWHLAVLIPLYAAEQVGAMAIVSTFVLKPSVLVWLVISFVWGERSKAPSGN